MKERFRRPILAAGELFSIASSAALAYFSVIDRGRGDLENSAREALGVVLGVALAAFFASELISRPGSQYRNNSQPQL